MSNIEQSLTEGEFASAGGRLNHVLDRIGFKPGRGRVTEFHTFLMEASPSDFSDLKYSTVKSWFQDSSPPLKKMDAVFQAILASYELSADLQNLKTWWKLGGIYPFKDSNQQAAASLKDARFSLLDALTDSGRDLSTLSGRLNALMDVSGAFPKESASRVLFLAEKYGASATEVSQWLEGNRIPERFYLKPILETVILSLEGDYSIDGAIAWLEFGNSVPSLFDSDSVSVKALSQDEIAMAFRTVVRVSRQLGVHNLDEALPEQVFDGLVREVLTDLTKRRRPRKPDEDLVERLLKDRLKAQFFEKWSS